MFAYISLLLIYFCVASYPGTKLLEMIISSGNMMGQGFRQGCTDGLLHTMSLGSPDSRQLATGLVQQGQRVSGTHLHYVGVGNWKAGLSQALYPPHATSCSPCGLLSRVRLPAWWRRAPRKKGPGNRRSLRTGLKSGTSSLLPYSHCQYQPRLQKKNSVKESVAYFVPTTLRARNVPYGSLHPEVKNQARSTRTKLEKDNHLES